MVLPAHSDALLHIAACGWIVAFLGFAVAFGPLLAGSPRRALAIMGVPAPARCPSQRGYRPRGWFDIALGWPEEQCRDFIAAIAAAQAVSIWHHSNFLIAEWDGQPAAALCAVPAAGTGPAAWAAIKEVGVATGLTASELEAIRRRGAYVRNCWVQGGEGDWMIEHVATDPAYRGRGLVQALIESRAGKGKGSRLPPRDDLVPDRQRAGRARLCQGRLQLRGRKA